MTADVRWAELAACTAEETRLFYAHNLTGQLRAIRTYCNRCPVRDPCLLDALNTPVREDHGVRGGTTRAERDRIRTDPNLPTGRDPVTIAALRRLLEEERPPAPVPAAPKAPRRARPRKEKTTVPMTLEDAVASAKQAVASVAAKQAARETAEDTTPKLPGGRELAELLAWADEHADAAIRRHSVRVRESLAALVDRSAADAELERINREKAELEARLAELNARVQEIAPRGATPKGRKDRDHDPKEVRAWATAHGYEVSPTGRVPQDIVDAWRQATASRLAASAAAR